MRTKTCVWFALCLITFTSIALMLLAIFVYEYENLGDKLEEDVEDDAFKTIKSSKSSLVLFYSLEDQKQQFQATWSQFSLINQNNTKGIQMRKIECSVFKATCNGFGVRRFPTIAWMENGKIIEEYVGDDRSASFQKFFDKRISMMNPENKIKIEINATVSTVTEVITKDVPIKGSSAKDFDVNKKFIENEKVTKLPGTSPTEAYENSTESSTFSNNVESKNSTKKNSTETEKIKKIETSIEHSSDSTANKTEKSTEEKFITSRPPKVSTKKTDKNVKSSSSFEGKLMTRPVTKDKTKNENDYEDYSETKKSRRDEADNDDSPDRDKDESINLGDLFNNAENDDERRVRDSESYYESSETENESQDYAAKRNKASEKDEKMQKDTTAFVKKKDENVREKSKESEKEADKKQKRGRETDVKHQKDESEEKYKTYKKVSEPRKHYKDYETTRKYYKENY